MAIRALTPDDGPGCDAIIRGLPRFFGDAGGVAACAEAVRTCRGWVSPADGDSGVRAFLTIEHPLESSPEITWMAVGSAWRRQGLGRALIRHAAGELRAEGAEVLSVLTLAASVRQSGADTYEGTRMFYRRMGFLPIREFRPDGWSSPALLLALPLPLAMPPLA